MNEPKYLLCAGVGAIKVVEGSTITNCVRCDKRVWIAPSGLQIMAEHKVEPLCFTCAKEMTPDEVNIHPPSKAQMKEIIKELKRDE